MKLSVSLTDDDVASLDRFVEQAGLASRSAGIQQAIRRLADPELERAYADAWSRWAADEETSWSAAIADGLDDATR